jgi:CspA family cold shock protein
VSGKIFKLMEKRFGFIRPSTGGKEIFFHQSSLGNCEWEALQIGQDVTFDTEDSEKGPRAIRICIP